MRRLFPLLVLAALAAGCSSSNSKQITIQPAKTYKLNGFEPAGQISPRKPTTVAFTINQPSGSALTDYRTGAGPHTGVHLIIVSEDLSTIIHRHPPMQAGGRVGEKGGFPPARRAPPVRVALPRQAGGGAAVS